MTDQIVQVVWKDEGMFGPVLLLTQKDLEQRDEGPIGRPFDPNREPPAWYTRAEAQALAAEHDAEFVES